MGESCRLYEDPSLRRVTGPTIRPGGLALTDRALALCALPAAARLLDIGCGQGATARHLAGDYNYSAIGLDLSALLLQAAGPPPVQLPGPALVRAPGEFLPLAEAAFDAVLAECCLTVMAGPDRVLTECYRVLRPGGWLIVSDIYVRNPAAISFLRRLPLDTCLRGAMSQGEMTGKLVACGFHSLAWEDHSAVLKQLAVQLIFAGGSMKQFWGGCGAANPAEVQSAISLARPGYFLLLARK